MCGLVGIFHYSDPERPVDRGPLQVATRRLRHRGPDDEGFHIDGPLGLGHRRLSIVDLSPTGHQPMIDGLSRRAIAYNGEFYDHRRYRDRLASHGVQFRGTSDTETLLHLLALDGPGVLADVSGIFAFAWWDAPRRRLILARDPLGVKQLYVHDDGKRIVFASEIKALFAFPGVPRRIDADGVNQYLHFHTPLAERTCFADIRQVPAGEYLEVDASGVRARRYWQLDGFDRRYDAESAVPALRRLLQDVVTDQLMSDVPVGVFFSGGIDSTAVAAIAAAAGHRLQLFGVHFSGTDVPDERPYQEAAAKALGLDLELTTVPAAQFPTDLQRAMYYQDEPVIGSAMLPMLHVSALAARKVKVVLGGQGSDEIFAGYARYALTRPWRVIGSWLTGRGRPAGDGARVGGNLGRQLWLPQNLRRLARLAPQLARGGDGRGLYFENFATVPEESWQAVLSRDLVSRRHARSWFDQVIDDCPSDDPTDRVLWWDIKGYLTGLFHQDDRMSMANSLESRVPIADPRVVRFAFHLPVDAKLRDGATKWVMRRAVAPVLPEMVLNRRKVGFDTPVRTWMTETHRDFVRDLLLSSAARQRGWFDPAGVAALLDTPDAPHWLDRVWKLVCLETWARLYFDGVSAPGIAADA